MAVQHGEIAISPLHKVRDPRGSELDKEFLFNSLMYCWARRSRLAFGKRGVKVQLCVCFRQRLGIRFEAACFIFIRFHNEYLSCFFFVLQREGIHGSRTESTWHRKSCTRSLSVERSSFLLIVFRRRRLGFEIESP